LTHGNEAFGALARLGDAPEASVPENALGPAARTGLFLAKHVAAEERAICLDTKARARGARKPDAKEPREHTHSVQ